MKTVLILGANGRFGQAAVQAFAAAGWQVLAQMRRVSATSMLPGVQPLQVPMADTGALLKAASAASVVVYGVNVPYTQWETEAMPLLQQGLAVAKGLGATFMLPGNVYNFGTAMPALLQETTPHQPDHTLARIREAMEAVLSQSAAEAEAQGLPLRCIVIRAGDFFGCGTGSWFDQAIVKNIAQGRLTYPGPLDVPHAWAYLPDLAVAFEKLASAPPGPRFETLHFAGHTLTGQELLQGLERAATAVGVKAARGFKRGTLPWGLIRSVGWVYPSWRELARMSYLWRMPHALDGSRLAARVALPPATPLDVALHESLVKLPNLTRQASTAQV